MATIRQLRTEQEPAGFFDRADFDVFREECIADAEYDEARLRVKEKLLALHDEIYPRMRELGWDLYPTGRRQSLVSPARVSEQNPKVERLILPYGKPELSRQMMRKHFGEPFRDIRSNALLAVTLEQNGVTTELVIADSAWVDAVNFRDKALGGELLVNGQGLGLRPVHDAALDLAAQGKMVADAGTGRILGWISLFIGAILLLPLLLDRLMQGVQEDKNTD